jgi:hypothetical protein
MSGELYSSSRGGSRRRNPHYPPPAELPTNCTSVKTSDNRETYALAGLIISMLIASVVAGICFYLAIKNRKLDKDDQIGPWIIGAFFAAAVGGLCYAIFATKEKFAKDRKESFPIAPTEVDICKKFLSFKFPDSEPVKELTTSGGSVTLPANKVIRKLKISGCNAQIQVTRANEDGTIAKSYIIQGKMKPIAFGFQSEIDALITNEPYTFSVVVTEGGDCNISYVVADLPEEFTEYVNKYQIIGRRCDDYVLSIDTTNDVIEDDKCWCQV